MGIATGALAGGLILPTLGIRSTALAAELLAAAALAVLLAGQITGSRVCTAADTNDPSRGKDCPPGFIADMSKHGER